MRPKMSLAAILAVTLLLAGCRGSAESRKPESAATGAPAESVAAVTASVEAGSPEAQAMAAKLLTPADVEKVSGMTGLKVVPKDPSIGAGGDTNIATAAGELVVMVNVGDGDFYEQTRSGPNFGREHTGTGDESYVGPAKDIMPVEYLLGVKSGQWGVVVTSFLDAESGTTPLLTIAQLEQLASVAISRL